MGEVKFYRGLVESYDAETQTDGIYFAHDIREVYLNEVPYRGYKRVWHDVDEQNTHKYSLTGGDASSSVMINGEYVTVQAGETIEGAYETLVFTDTFNLKSVHICGTWDGNLPEYSSSNPNTTLEYLEVDEPDDHKRSYESFCENYTALKEVKLIGVKVTSFTRCFRACSALESVLIQDIDFTPLTEVNQMFYNTYKLSSVVFKDCFGTTSNFTNMGNMFNGCIVEDLDVSWINDTSSIEQCNAMWYNLPNMTHVTIGDWDLNNCTKNMNNWMYGCTSLTTIDGAFKNIMLNVDCSYAPLDHDTALMIINGLYDYSGGTAHTLTLSSTTKGYLTDDDKAIATNKNWSIA